MSTLALISDVVLAQSSQGLADTVRNFIGPFLLLAAGIASMTFLFQRQIMQFIIFLVIFVLVAMVFYAPEIISNLGTSFGENNQSWG